MGNAQGADFKVRGYMVTNAGTFLRDTVRAADGEGAAALAIEGLSAPIREIINSGNAGGWYPVEMISEVFRAVAALGKGDEARARDLLVKAGAYNAREATNTFLRLLMKMLTPALLSRKLPSLWKRDCTMGRLEVSVHEQKLICRFYEMEGFDHVVVATAGYLRFVFEAMGKKIEDVAIHDWSLEKPYVDGARIELVFSN